MPGFQAVDEIGARSHGFVIVLKNRSLTGLLII
jgi:hypothetical protein